MDRFSLTSEGIAFYVLANYPELDKRILSDLPIPPEWAAEFEYRYTSEEALFVTRFQEFARRCISDPAVRDDLRKHFLAIKEMIAPFIETTDEPWQKAIHKSEDKRPYEALEIFAEALDNEDLNLEEEIEKSRKRCYY